MSTDWVKDINEMHTKFGVRDAVKNFDSVMLRTFLRFRLDFLHEELGETENAAETGKPIDSEEVVDGLIDLCVVAIGTLDALGVDPHKAWDNVLAANMAKEVGIKPERPNPLGLPDLIKPADWKAPSHQGNHGIIANSFSDKIKERMEVANKARTDILADNPDINSKWTPDAISHSEKVSIDLVDFTKDSEYIRMMGDMNANS